VNLAEVILEVGKGNPQDLAEALEGKIDEKEVAKIRLESARFYLEQAERNMITPDIASEDLYKAILEGMKSLKSYLGISEDLRCAIPKISEILGEWIDEAWEIGTKLHYEGYISENFEESDLPFYLIKVKKFIENCEIAIS
jgi:hypothetical protein